MLNFIIGLFIGAIVSLFLYACVVVGKQAEERIYKEEEKSE